MSLYTKEQFEEYKGKNKSLTIIYMHTDHPRVEKEHGTYEEYLDFYKSFTNQNSTYLTPNALPKVVERSASDKWDNAIREFGVGNACEWFGYEYDGDFAKSTVEVLQERYEQSKLYEEIFK